MFKKFGYRDIRALPEETNHDRLMVAPIVRGLRFGRFREEGPESARKTRPAELVIEAGRADWGFEHNVKT